MRKWARLPLSWVAVLPTALVLMAPGPATAQECMVGTFGPLTLAARETMTLCVTNLDAPTPRRVGFAFYDAFHAREPLKLEYADLARGAGACISFRPSREDSRTIVARAGFVRAVDDPAQPLALSAKTSSRSDDGDVDGRDFLVWQRGDPPPPPPPV
jgi:hypothetical protein